MLLLQSWIFALAAVLFTIISVTLSEYIVSRWEKHQKEVQEEIERLSSHAEHAMLLVS
jgi:ABC-type multidrug transport system fused ATPase/permease subunit